MKKSKKKQMKRKRKKQEAIEAMYVREVVALRHHFGSALSEDNVYDHINSYFPHYSSFRVVVDEGDANGNLDGCVDFFRRTIIHPEGWLMAVEYAGAGVGIRYTFSYTTSKEAEHDNVRWYLGREELSNCTRDTSSGFIEAGRSYAGGLGVV